MYVCMHVCMYVYAYLFMCPCSIIIEWESVTPLIHMHIVFYGRIRPDKVFVYWDGPYYVRTYIHTYIHTYISTHHTGLSNLRDYSAEHIYKSCWYNNKERRLQLAHPRSQRSAKFLSAHLLKGVCIRSSCPKLKRTSMIFYNEILWRSLCGLTLTQ
jgi:hypothetical protein